MSTTYLKLAIPAALIGLLPATPAAADVIPFFFSAGYPDGTSPFVLGPDHVFFRPEVDLGNAGNFLWLSAPKPIVSPGTPFPPGFTDLQTWIRTDGPGALAPDWERIGADVTHQGPFNAAFSLTGFVLPEPSTWAMMLIGFAGLGYTAFRRARLMHSAF
jgi:PEP-CTERM motif